jgi:hypothetical protein
MSTDLIAALRAALHADEAAARAAAAGPWRYGQGKRHHVVGTGETDDAQCMADAAHIARHDPVRVLADIAAKRAVLDLHRPVRRRSTGSGGVIEDCGVCSHFPAQYPCTTLRLLAEAYGIRV